MTWWAATLSDEPASDFVERVHTILLQRRGQE